MPMSFTTLLRLISGIGENIFYIVFFFSIEFTHLFIIFTILYVHILCVKYKEENQTLQRQPQKCRRHDLMGDNSFPKDEEWNTDGICDAEQQGKDLTTQEIDIS